MNKRFELKAATQDLHDSLDKRLSCLNLSTEPDYLRFLEFHARTLPPIESQLAAAGLDALVSGWAGSRRAPSLEADFGSLGRPMPPSAKPPSIKGTGEILGTAYVIEGSRLGAPVLRKRVASRLPASFLSDDGSPGPWLTLTAVIERLLCSGPLLREAKYSARRCFGWFLSVADEAGIR